MKTIIDGIAYYVEKTHGDVYYKKDLNQIYSDVIHRYNNVWLFFKIINNSFKLHRNNGAAVIYANDKKEYWFDVKHLTFIKNDKEFEKWKKIKVFL